MGMTLQMRRCSVATAETLRANSGFLEFVMPGDYDAVPDSELIDIDKSWHAIHFLLTGEAWSDALPQGALFAGEAVGGDPEVEPVARLLDPETVKAFAGYLSTKPDDFVETTLDFAALEAADIYPQIWDRKDQTDIEYVALFFRGLRSFVQEAAAANEAIVQIIV